MAPEEEEEGEAEEGPGAARERRAQQWIEIQIQQHQPVFQTRGRARWWEPAPPNRLGGLEGELSASPAPASRVFLSGCRSRKEAGGSSEPGVSGPQGKSSRLAELPRSAVVPRAMPAQLALSSSRGSGRLGLPERAGPASGPRPLPAPVGRRPALATNFSQVSCAGAAAPLSARSPRSVRPRVRRAQGPSPPASPAGAEQAPGGGAGGGDLRKTRHHLYSQVRAGAAPARPTPVAPRAPSGPRPPLRRSRGGESPGLR